MSEIVTSVGIVGLENSHVDHFLRYFNAEEHFPGWRVTTVTGGPPERAHDLATAYGLEVVAEPRDVIGRVDAALLCHRDGGVHRDHAVPLLQAGIDVFVDKPLALSAADAEEMTTVAMATGAVLQTGSAFRYVETAQAAAHRARATPPRLVVVTGPADPLSPHGGLFFYGIHHVELLLEILGGPDVTAQPVDLQVARDRGTAVAVGRIGATSFVLTFVEPEAQGSFRAHVGFGADVMDIDLGHDAVSYDRLLDRFVAACATREPADMAGLVPPVALLERIAAIL